MEAWKREAGIEAMDIRMYGSLQYLAFPALDALDTVRHAFSTRTGGVSEGFLSTMNFSFDRGDRPENVRENYRRVAEAIGVDPHSFCIARQTHTTNLRVVTEKDRGSGIDFERPYRDIDGLVTNVRGITLVTFHADCIPLWFADPVHEAIGLAHAGWLGTVNGMGAAVVRTMREEYGTSPEDLTVCIGPGICTDCYEIGGDVIKRFEAAFPGEERERVLKDFHVREDGPHWQLDLKEANRLLLIREGVPAERIHLSDICTRCNHEQLFSHRHAGVRRGLNAAFLALK